MAPSEALDLVGSIGVTEEGRCQTCGGTRLMARIATCRGPWHDTEAAEIDGLVEEAFAVLATDRARLRASLATSFDRAYGPWPDDISGGEDPAGPRGARLSDEIGGGF